jgi:hypothetical protein
MKHFVTRGGDEVQDWKRENGRRMENSECLLNVDKDRECLLNDKTETLMQQNGKYRTEYIDVAAQHDIFWNF